MNIFLQNIQSSLLETLYRNRSNLETIFRIIDSDHSGRHSVFRPCHPEPLKLLPDPGSAPLKHSGDIVRGVRAQVRQNGRKALAERCRAENKGELAGSLLKEELIIAP